MEKARFRRDLDKKVDRLFEKIAITKRAFTKMNAYARTVSNIAGDHIECGGLLIGEHREGLPVVTDAVLLEGVVTHASGHFDHDSMNKEYLRARDEGKLIMGMWHSHGSFGVFHSGHDDAYLDLLLDRNERILPNLLLKSVKETPLLEGHVCITDSSLSIAGQSGQSYDVRFIAPDKKSQETIREALCQIEGAYVKKMQGVPFAASIVINKESYDHPERITDPKTGRTVYAETVSKHPCLKEKRIKRRGIPLHIIDEGTDRHDEQPISQEVCDKITYQGEKLSARAQEIGPAPSRKEEKTTASAGEQKTIHGHTIETKIESDPVAKAYERIVQSPEYEAAINKKVARKYHMLQAKRLLQKLGPDCARQVYLRYEKEQEHGQAQKKAA